MDRDCLQEVERAFRCFTRKVCEFVCVFLSAVIMGMCGLRMMCTGVEHLGKDGWTQEECHGARVSISDRWFQKVTKMVGHRSKLI